MRCEGAFHGCRLLPQGILRGHANHPAIAFMQALTKQDDSTTPLISATFPVKPEHFWTIFSETFRADWNDSKKQASQFYNDAAKWTPYITEFIKNLSARFSCIAKTEWWPKIDVCYFDRNGGAWEEWALEVAIELENNLNWQEELSKLLAVNAGLKVLIAYENEPQRINEVLDQFVRIHGARKYPTSNCGWLFIFGPRLIPASFDFVAFSFDGHAIVDITGSKKTIF